MDEFGWGGFGFESLTYDLMMGSDFQQHSNQLGSIFDDTLVSTLFS